MITFPNAKINLGLNIVSKRVDGYHNISSCFYPIGWSDILEIIPSDEFLFTRSGLEIGGSPNNNLCVKAYDLLSKHFDLSPVHIHLHKIIPMGAGLGGGSSDGAFTLKLLNEMFGLKISTQQLQNYAAQLGSDCTFFIENKPTLVSGVGDKLETCDFLLDNFKLMVVYPGIHVSTKEAYSNIIFQESTKTIDELLIQGVKLFREDLKNDFETSVGVLKPEIIEIKEKLYEQGAVYASMSGSGSAVFGIFEKEKNIESIIKNFESMSAWTETF